jgi:hypothetical protein
VGEVLGLMKNGLFPSTKSESEECEEPQFSGTIKAKFALENKKYLIHHS